MFLFSDLLTQGTLSPTPMLAVYVPNLGSAPKESLGITWLLEYPGFSSTGRYLFPQPQPPHFLGVFKCVELQGTPFQIDVEVLANLR